MTSIPTIRPSAFFLPILALSLIARCIEANISVPAFPAMVDYFGVMPSTIQLTIVFDCLGCCLGCPFYGPLSDAYGRRPVMIWGNLILLIGALGCVVAPNIPWLLTSRFIQGVGTATSLSVAFAMVADVYKGDAGVRAIGFMNSILVTSMAIAPVAGALIFQVMGWRATYGVVALVCALSVATLIAYLPETKRERPSFRFKEMGRNYFALARDLPFMSASIIPSILYAGFFSFVACAPFLYMTTLGLPLVLYACNQGLVVAAYAVTNMLAGLLGRTLGDKRVVILGCTLVLSGSMAFLLGGLFATPSALWITPVMLIYSVGCGCIYPIVFTASMEMFPAIKGTAASAVMFTRSVLLAIWIALTALIYNGTTVSVAVLVVSSTLIALLCARVVIPRLTHILQKG